jgi:hypothetical protein
MDFNVPKDEHSISLNFRPILLNFRPIFQLISKVKEQY